MAMHRGIVTVTLNPSIDVTLWLDGLDPDRANRVEAEAREAGGKGINVSRVVRSFGLDSLCLAVAGADNSREFARFLEDAGLRYEMLHVEGAVRENLTLRTGDQTVKLNRRGPSMTTMMIGALMALIRSHIHPGDIVVFAGSLPEHVDVQDYAELILAVKNAGALVAVDSDALKLEDYKMIRPWLIKPNIHEARHILEIKDDSPLAVAEAARKLREIGVENAMISMGGTACSAPLRRGWPTPQRLRWRSNPPWEPETAPWRALSWVLSRAGTSRNACGWRPPAAPPPLCKTAPRWPPRTSPHPSWTAYR